MTLIQLESRITRAELRMQLAISRKWKRLWSCAFIAAVSEKRAQTNVNLVRKKKQPLALGAAGGGSGVVVPLPRDRDQPTTDVCGREVA
jgi:hypothetical protein